MPRLRSVTPDRGTADGGRRWPSATLVLDRHVSEFVVRFCAGAHQSPRISLVTIAGRLAPIAVIDAFVVTVALSMAATPRRTGDAHQYIAMTLQGNHPIVGDGSSRSRRIPDF